LILIKELVIKEISPISKEEETGQMREHSKRNPIFDKITLKIKTSKETNFRSRIKKDRSSQLTSINRDSNREIKFPNLSPRWKIKIEVILINPPSISPLNLRNFPSSTI